MVVPAEQAADVFPAVRYFQIHFEFLQEQIQLILQNHESLQLQMQQLESQLSRSAHGMRLDSKALSPIERLTTHRNATQDTDTPNLNLTGGR
ncbi:MAG: hypothetical protein CVV06_17850 [Gammaproteobacteria bacterium HGW-Gammaproteobacteria-10]|nr:MAG: hypothetical protein CVV13_14860 [Gammaproteobacteria bacterium HGW-Gammaproteobacteria-3]PKM35142.1 MAG: hypothetical protein CVV06_17850 [Gammaproteobacteria bacterium HGW-Gammaproteobacteria-10]